MAEWTTVQDESPDVIIFDTVGDQFIGTYVGTEEIENEGETFTRFLFRNDKGFFAINSSYRLAQGMGKVQTGELVRLTYIKNVDTSSGKLNPMKDIKVEVSR